MNLNNRQKVLYSEALTYTANSAASVKLGFLEPLRRWSPNPIIEYLSLRFQLVVNTGTSATLGKYLAQLLSRIIIKDGQGERVNLTGYELRLISAYELGNGYQDPRALGISQTGLAVEFFMRIPLKPYRAHDRADFGIHALELLDVGELIITFGGTTAGPAQNVTNVTAGTVVVEARAVDRGQTAKSRPRMCWFSRLLDLQEKYIPVHGNIRSAFAAIGVVAQNAGTAWAAQNIISQTLEYNRIASSVLADMYRAENPFVRSFASSGSAATEVAEDPVLAGEVIPIVWPEFDQENAQHMAVEELHYLTDGTVTQGNLGSIVVAAYLDRSPDMVARVIGAQSGSHVLAATASSAAVVPSSNPSRGAVQWKQVAATRRRALSLEIHGPRTKRGMKVQSV